MKRANKNIWGIIGAIACLAAIIAVLYKNEILSFLSQQAITSTLSSVAFFLMFIIIIIISLEVSIQSATDSDERLQLIRNKASFETLKYSIICLICTPGLTSFLGLQATHCNIHLVCLSAAALIGALYLTFFTYYYLKMT